MKSKLTKVVEARFSLPLAACLGATFSWDLLKVVLDGFHDNKEAWEMYHTIIFENTQKDEGQNDRGADHALSKFGAIYTDYIILVCFEKRYFGMYRKY